MSSNTVALAVQPPPQPQGPLQMAQGGLSVQALINQAALQKQQEAANATAQQSQQIDLQEKQQQQQDQQKFNQAFHDANGDWGTTIDNATKNGVSGTFITRAQMARADQVTKLATADKDTLANEMTRHDELAKDAVKLLNTDPEDRQQVYTQLVNKHLISGAYKPGTFPATVPSDDDLKSTVAQSKAAQDVMKDAADLQAKTAALPGAKAESSAKELATASQFMNGAPNQLAWSARRQAAANSVSPETLALIPENFSPEAAESVRQLGIAPKDLANQSPDKLELASFLKNPPKGYGATPVEFLRYQKSIAPNLNFNLSANTGNGGAPADVAKRFGMNQEAFDQAAERYNSTGTLPPVGRGTSGPALQRALMNRAGELHPGETLAANSAEYKANEGSLKKLQTNFDQVNAFENTALKNLDQVAITGAKVPDLSARFANVPVRMISSQMIGTPEMAQFKTALLTAQTEAAKVLGSANASGVLSDSARHEAQEVLDGNLPYPAMMATINQLKTDFGNRHQSYQDQIGDIQKRLRGGGGGSGGQAETSGGGGGSAIPPAVSKVLANVGTGRHKLSDGSVWDKKADGSIVKAQ